MNKIDTIQYIQTNVFKKIKNKNLIKFNSEMKHPKETIQDTNENKFDQTLISKNI